MTNKNSEQVESETSDVTVADSQDNPTPTDGAAVEAPSAKAAASSNTSARTSKAKKRSTPAKSEIEESRANKSAREPVAKQASQDSAAGRGVKLAMFAIMLTLFLGAGSAFLVSQKNSEYQAKIAQLEAQLNALNSQIEERLSDTEQATQVTLDSAVNRVDTALTQQQRSIESLQLALADVKGRNPNDWLLAEADYLVKLAGRKLFLEKDVESATQLMESADQRIAALNDPSLVPLRKEMATDITQLKSIPLVDKDGLALRLISLQQQVDTLPLANAILPDAPMVEQAAVSDDISDWQSNLFTSLKDFSEQFITFRTRDGNVIPLLSPQQHYYLKENVKGKLERAIRAVYREDQAIYDASLSMANTWASQFFKLDDPAVVQFDKSVQQLADQEVGVTYPQTLVSLKALEGVINSRLRRQVTSLITEDAQ